MTDVKLRREGGIAYREAIPAGDEFGDPVLLVHGFPQSSYWSWTGSTLRREDLETGSA